MDNKKQTVYVDEYDVLLPYEGETKTQLDYKADILVGKKSPKKYVAMLPYDDPSLDETKRLIFNNAPAQAYTDVVGSDNIREISKAYEEGGNIIPSSNEGKSKAFDQPYEPEDYSDRQNTQLTEEEELQYQEWAKANGREKDVFDYDLRGFWKEMNEGKLSEDERGHLSDKYKKSNHPTFSKGSIYANEGLPGEWKKNKYGNWVFHAPKNIGKGQQAYLQEYFKNYEKGSGLAFETDIVMDKTDPVRRKWEEYVKNFVITHNAPKEKNNWFKTSMKGLGSAGVGMLSSIDKGFTEVGADFGVWVAEWIVGEKLPAPFKQAAYRELAESIRNLDEKTWGGLKKITAKTSQDSDFLYNLTAGGGSLGISWLGGLATKSARFSAILFGSSEGADFYSYAREKGIDPLKAFGFASVVGVGTGALEKWGLHDFFDKYTIKSLKAFGGKVVAKQMGSEFTQEFSQSALSNVARMALTGEGDWREILAQAAEEGFYGALISPVVGGMHLAVTGKIREKWSKVFQERGLNKDDADRLAAGLILNRDDALNHAKEIIDDEAITQAMLSPEEKEESMRQGEDLLDSLLDQASSGISDELQSAVDQVNQNIYEEGIKSGLSEEDARSTAKLGSLMARSSIIASKEMGMSDNEISEMITLNITNAENIEKSVILDEYGNVVEEREIPVEEGSTDDMPYTEDEEYISLEDERKFIREQQIQEEVETLMASGMSEDEARFRVETGREPTDFDRAIGFNYIPYQTQEFTEEETQAMGIMNNPDREQIVANMSEEEKKNFNALEQSVKNKELYNQSIDLQKEMNDIDRAEFDAGVPMWDKDTININGVERAVTNSSGKKIAHSEKSLRMFYEWFGDSKVVDADGRPLVVYHGTNAKFNVFKQGVAEGWGKGSYFTDNIEDAQDFGGRVMAVYLNIQNPYTGDIDTLLNTPTVKEKGIDVVDESGILVGQAIREAGFDGIIAKGSNGINGLEVVAFSPNQIKSTSNTGTFSKASDDIRYQTGYHGGADFDEFTLDNVGKNGSKLGVGVYITKEKGRAKPYVAKDGALYEVEYPEDFEFINEGARLNDQSDVVKAGIQKIESMLTDEQREIYNQSLKDAKNRNRKQRFGNTLYGMDYYIAVKQATKNNDEAVKLFNSVGIKGNMQKESNFAREEFCVFNPKDVKIISKEKAQSTVRYQAEELNPIETVDILNSDPERVEFNIQSMNNADEQQLLKDAAVASGKMDEKTFNEFYKTVKKFAQAVYDRVVKTGTSQTFVDWSNQTVSLFKDSDGIWKPIRSIFVNNGDYEFNIDFGTVCVKREGADRLVKILIDKKYGQNLGLVQLDRIKKVLIKYGIATACDVCFVETKRVNARDLTNGFIYEWESVRQALGIDDDYYVSQQHQYEFSKEQQELIDRMASLDYIGDNGEIISATELEKMRASMSKDAYKKWKDNHKQVYQVAYDEIFGVGGRLEERARGKKKKDAIDRGITADKMRMIAKLISENSGMAGKFDPDALMNAEYTSNIVEKYFGTNILNALSSYAGAGTPKALLKSRPYSERSWYDPFDKKNNKDELIVKLFEIGGVRGQSFSDYDQFMVIDYLQKYIAQYLRGLPAHEYTKVPDLIKTFGKTGVMFNMSLLPEIKLNFGNDTEMNKKYAGLQRATQEQIDAYNNSVKNGTVKEDLIEGKIVNVMTDKNGSWTYAWHRDSFPVEEAFKLRRNKDYGGRVGIIAVGTSSKQIKMMLADPTIDMIIPYHSSGMPAHTKMTTGLNNATDYQKVQTTKKPKGVKDDFNYNVALRELKDPRKAAQAYLDWCKVGNGKKKYTPKFKEFADDENYYKVLEDFRGYDNDGNPVIQQAVDFSKWTDADWQEFAENAFLGIKQKEADNIQMNKAMSALDAMPDAEGSVDENAGNIVAEKQSQLGMNDNEKDIAEAIRKEIEEAIKFQRIDEANKSIIFGKLRKALGGQSVKSFPQDEFMSELFKIKGIEGDEQKIETFRKEKDGIIYGFAHKNIIYLNENVFNAHAPVHEFTHIWAKVVQKVNPDLWDEGVKLLQESKVWLEVVNDSNYYDIANDNNAIASEVLARIVGRKGESLIQSMLDPNTKLYTEKGKDNLLKKVMAWFEKVIGQVLETFGWKKGDKLTLEDFAKLPIADLFDDKRAEVFKKNLEKAKVNKDLEVEFMARYDQEVKEDMARYQTGVEEKNLVVTHGTTLEKLEEALRLGAMPMPSLAVTKSELATGDQYGEITFVGGYDIINPNKDKANKTFAADIYSPRREKPEYELNSDGIEYIKRQTGNVSKKGDSYWTSNIEYALNNEQDYLLKEVYLASIGKISDLDGSTYSIVWEMTDKQKDDFKKWKNKLINEYTDKKIFKGVTPSGNRKYVPYDLKNILQELKQKALRGSEEGMGGTAHALRGVWADELKNIEEIRKRKDKLVDEETYKKLDNIIWDETAKLTDLLVSEKLAEDLANDLVNPEEYMIEEALKLIKPSSDIANILAKADLRSDKKAVDAVKKYMTLLKNTPVKYFESKPARAVDFSEFEGVLIPSDAEYDAVARELEEQGVKQVLRYGSKEEKNQLINRMQKVFFQTEGGDGGERKPLKPYKRNPLKVLGQYEPTKKMITLFKGRNPTTLIHEMGHHYLPIQLRMLEKAGKWDKLKPLYKELGISSVEKMGRDAEEKLIDMFTSYIYYNEAPNAETQSIFERAKQWAINAYNTVKNYVKPSEEVTKFFDELIAGEETAPDISHLVGKENELAEILKGAREGKELTVNGLSMKDIAILRKALYARIPRKGRSLADIIRKAGGIKLDSELAKALGYDSRKGNEKGFWKKDGAIDSEDSLIEFLVTEGFLTDAEQDTAEGVQAVWSEVENLINNRDTSFNDKNQMQNDKRARALEAVALVDKIVQQHYDRDIAELEKDMKAVTQKLADVGAVAVDIATLEYLERSVKNVDKEYRKLLKTLEEEKDREINKLKGQRDRAIERDNSRDKQRYKLQEEITNFIKNTPLNNKDKLKLINKIRMVKDERTFEKYLGEAKSQIEKYVETESKRVLDDLIQKEIKSSRPRKAMAQLYNYENNKLFADLREWNKLNQTEAEIKADQLDDAIAKGNGELSRTDKLRRMFLEYKSFGKDCSVEFMQALHDEIKAAKQAGIDAKDDLDFKRAFEREQDREAILEKIKESNFDKNSFIGKVVNAYRNGISNLYSMLNSLVGKEIAEKFQFETIVENKQVKEWKHLKKVNQKAQKIYGVKSYGELLNLMADKGKKMFVIYKKKDTESFEGSLSDDFYHELSVLDLIDIYNSMKNIKTSDDYAKAYGIEQINALLANLTEQDKAFADMLMEDVNSRYKAINKVYINLYGMDLKRVDNYWMSSTEHSTPIDVLNDMRMQSTTPGFFKERTSGSVIPLPKNAWLKYQNHIAQGYYMTEVAEKFKEMAEVFKSKRIENMITNKFGEKVYKTLIDQIEAIGLNASPASVDDMSKWYNKLVSNWVGAKIALNPVVFVGQLTSFTNYAVDVPTKAYLKNFMYALRHPKEVFDFMMKHNKDFLMHRYESGFNEAMSRFITQAESLNSMKFGLSPKSKFGWANILSSLVRMGDMGSLIFGGYGQFKTMLDNGMSVEEAKKKFEFATLRSQQSGNAASIAKIQRVPNGLSMLFLPFKNTAMQYGRKIVDTVVSYQNGDITKAQATKTLTNYLFIQPALWVFIRNIAKDILGLDDEDDEYTDGILEQILVNPIEMIPFAGESFKAAYSIITDEKLYGVYSMPLFDDIEKSWRKLAKEEKDIFDWVDIISPVVEGLTATPIQTPKRYAQKWFGEE